MKSVHLTVSNAEEGKLRSDTMAWTISESRDSTYITGMNSVPHLIRKSEVWANRGVNVTVSNVTMNEPMKTVLHDPMTASDEVRHKMSSI